MKFNLHGRINFNYLLAFGFVAVLFVKLINIVITILMNKIDYNILLVVTMLISIGFILDVIISCLACYRQRNRREGKTAKNKLEEILDVRFDDKRLKKIYPNSSIIK